MSEGDGVCASEELISDEKLLLAHKKERKELQAKIQSLKHSVPKGDKKRKKEIVAEIAKLELQLSQKHEAELDEAKKLLNDVNKIDEGITKILTEDENAVEISEIKTTRITKAQKRRDRKANKEREREQQIAQQELENLQGARNLEAEKLKQLLKGRNLTIFEVPSDGNCLYKAVEHQLSLRGISTTVTNLRKETSDYMRSNSDDFIPFLTSQTTGDIITADEFQQYCDDLVSTSVWGGQVELNALAHFYQLPIEVIQADGPTIIIGEKFGNNPLILSYHRYIYGLGEHYNSVMPEIMSSNNAEL